MVDPAIQKKIKTIFKELSEHPTQGTGKVEALRGNLSGCWSRRLNRQHRIIYEIHQERVTVFVLAMRGHYGES